MESSLGSRKKLPVTIIGAGAVGSALALSLRKKNYFIRAIISRKGRSAGHLGTRVRVSRIETPSSHAPIDGIVFIAVPDDEIKNVVRDLVRQQDDFSRTVIFHTSGASSSTALLPLKKRGAVVGSFHPLQTFPKLASGSTSLRRIFVAIEGDRKAIKSGTQIALRLGARPFVLSSENKVLYHVAAVFASNYFVTLLSIVEELGMRIGMPQTEVISMFEPLILQSLKNVKKHSAAPALTGPIARGDVTTLKRHRNKLNTTELKHISELYSALAKVTARLASKKTR